MKHLHLLLIAFLCTTIVTNKLYATDFKTWKIPCTECGKLLRPNSMYMHKRKYCCQLPEKIEIFLQKNKRAKLSHQDLITQKVAKKTIQQQFMAKSNLKTKLKNIAKKLPPLIIPPRPQKTPPFSLQDIATMRFLAFNQPSHFHNN